MTMPSSSLPSNAMPAWFNPHSVATPVAYVLAPDAVNLILTELCRTDELQNVLRQQIELAEHISVSSDIPLPNANGWLSRVSVWPFAGPAMARWRLDVLAYWLELVSTLAPALLLESALPHLGRRYSVATYEKRVAGLSALGYAWLSRKPLYREAVTHLLQSDPELIGARTSYVVQCYMLSTFHLAPWRSAHQVRRVADDPRDARVVTHRLRDLVLRDYEQVTRHEQAQRRAEAPQGRRVVRPRYDRDPETDTR